MKKLYFILVFVLLCIYEVVCLARTAFSTRIGIGGNFISLFESTFLSETSIVLYVLFTFIYVLLHKDSSKFSGLSKVFLSFNIYIYVIAIFYSLLYPFSTISTYATLLAPLLSFFFFLQVFCCVGRKTLNISVLLLFVLMVYAYSVTYNTRSLEIFLVGQEYFISNASYYVVFLLPFLLCIKDMKLKVIAILVSSIVTLSSMKRGSTVCLGIGLIMFLLEYNRTFFKRRFLLKAFLFTTIIFWSVYYIAELLSESSGGYLTERFGSIIDDKGTHRLDIYETTINMILSSSITQLLIGHGWNRVVADSPLNFSAHNDFLEILYDTGLIGLVLLIGLLVKLWQWFIQLHRKKSEFSAPLGASLGTLLFGMLYSHVIFYPYYYVIFCATWGYIYSASKEETKSIISNSKLLL